jgi:hypothetical protein
MGCSETGVTMGEMVPEPTDPDAEAKWRVILSIAMLAGTWALIRLSRLLPASKKEQ